MVLRNRHFEIIHWCEIVRCGGLTDNVLSVGNRDGHCIALLISKHLRATVFCQDDRLRLREIIASVLLCRQGADQVSGEAHTFQQIRIGLAVVGSLNHLERLLDDLLFGSRSLLHRFHQVAFVGTVQIILLLIQQISFRRNQLLDEIFPEIQVLDERLAVIIGRQRRHLCTGLIEDTCLSVRMVDILPGIEAVSCFAELRIALGFPGLRVHLDEVDPGIHPLILECMGKCCFRLFIIGVGESERIHVLLVPVVVLRGLHFLHVIAVVDGQVRFECGAAVRPGRNLFYEGILLYDHLPVGGLDIRTGVKAINASRKRVLRGIVLLYHGDLRLLAVVFDRDAAEDHFPGQVCEGQGDVLALPIEDKVLRRTGFLHGVGTEEQVVQRYASVIACHQAVLHQVTFLIDHPAAGGFDLRTGIDSECRALLLPDFVLEGRSRIRHIRANQHFAFLVNGQLPADLLILKSMGEGDRRLLVVGIGGGKMVRVAAVQLISGRRSKLLHVELKADRKIRSKLPFPVIPGSHLADQGILLHDDGSADIGDIRIRVKAVDRTANRRLRQFVLLQCSHLHLLAFIGKCRRSDDGIRAVAAFA